MIPPALAWGLILLFALFLIAIAFARHADDQAEAARRLRLADLVERDQDDADLTEQFRAREFGEREP